MAGLLKAILNTPIMVRTLDRIGLRPSQDDLRGLRNARLISGSVSSVAARFVSAVAGLVVVPLSLGYLGAERYGAWLAVAAVITMLGFADLGIANGLVNLVSTVSVTKDHVLARKTLACAMVCQAVIGAVLFVTGLLIVLWEPSLPARILGLVNLSEEVRNSILVALGLFALTLPAACFSAVLRGLQLGFLVNFCTMVATLLGLFLLMICVYLKSSMPVLVVSLCTTNLFAGLLSGWIILRRHRDYLPAWKFLSLSGIYASIRIGFKFLILQFSSSFAISIPSLFVANALGPASLVEYSLVYKVFLLVRVVGDAMSGAAWPAFREALDRKDGAWLRSSTGKIIKLSLVTVLLPGLPLILFGPSLFSLWVGTEVTVGRGLIAGFLLYTVITAMTAPLAMLCNAAKRMAGQIVAACSQVALLWLIMSAPLAQLSLLAVPLYMTLCFLLSHLFLYYPMLRDLLTRRYHTLIEKADG